MVLFQSTIQSPNNIYISDVKSKSQETTVIINLTN